jgi:hypothetical protein
MFKRSLTPMLMFVLAAGAIAAAPALAATPSLPAASGAWHICPRTVFTASHDVTVQGSYAIEKGKKPATKLLSCTSADAVVLAGKRYGPNPGVGKQITVSGVRYTAERSGNVAMFGGRALSGPIEGWVGGGVIIPLLVGF